MMVYLMHDDQIGDNQIQGDQNCSIRGGAKNNDFTNEIKYNQKQNSFLLRNKEIKRTMKFKHSQNLFFYIRICLYE